MLGLRRSCSRSEAPAWLLFSSSTTPQVSGLKNRSAALATWPGAGPILRPGIFGVVRERQFPFAPTSAALPRMKSQQPESARTFGGSSFRDSQEFPRAGNVTRLLWCLPRPHPRSAPVRACHFWRPLQSAADVPPWVPPFAHFAARERQQRF